MLPATAVAKTQIIHLRDTDWATYQTLRDNPVNHRTRMIFDQGELYQLDDENDRRVDASIELDGVAVGRAIAMLRGRHGTDETSLIRKFREGCG